jgi:hypothetical protein
MRFPREYQLLLDSLNLGNDKCMTLKSMFQFFKNAVGATHFKSYCSKFDNKIFTLPTNVIQRWVPEYRDIFELFYAIAHLACTKALEATMDSRAKLIARSLILDRIKALIALEHSKSQESIKVNVRQVLNELNTMRTNIKSIWPNSWESEIMMMEYHIKRLISSYGYKLPFDDLKKEIADERRGIVNIKEHLNLKASKVINPQHLYAMFTGAVMNEDPLSVFKMFDPVDAVPSSDMKGFAKLSETVLEFIYWTVSFSFENAIILLDINERQAAKGTLSNYCIYALFALIKYDMDMQAGIDGTQDFVKSLKILKTRLSIDYSFWNESRSMAKRVDAVIVAIYSGSSCDASN